MSMERGSVFIPASPHVVREVLLRPLEMVQWNPAFRAIEGPPGASVGFKYALKTVQGLSGSFWYDAISEDRIDMSWTVPGFTEHGTWELREATYGTSVMHQFVHSGPLAALLRAAYRGVADLRLQRLTTRALSGVVSLGWAATKDR
jgi:hypothetical protein